MANPTGSPPFGSHTKGVWLHPYESGLVSDHLAWIAADALPMSAEMDVEMFSVSRRREKISQRGPLHLDEGTIEGQVVAGRGLTATQWLDRLQYLIVHQDSFRRIMLVTNRLFFRVELLGIQKDPITAGGDPWRVSVPFREMEWNP